MCKLSGERFLAMIARGLTVITVAATLQACHSGADTKPSPAPADTTAPTPPASLTLTVINSNRIDLSWSASSDAVGVAGYRIFRNGTGTPLATTTMTTYSDTTVVAGSHYSYVVSAFDAAGNVSDPSASQAATTPGTAPTTGLDARPSNTTCLAWERPTAGSGISLAPYTSFSFSAPVAMLQAPNDSSRWFVVEQAGAVRQFAVNSSASPGVFVDITARVRSGGEMGLLGMAFHPNFPTDNRVFLSYTTGTSPLVSRISAFRSTDGGATLDPNSEQVLLTVNQPEQNHNGGLIAFGPPEPDRYLYIGLGDGGGGGDMHGNPGNGQALTTMLGKMLRIDIDLGAGASTTYEIPATNPFAQNAQCPAAGRTTGECPEIYAWGFRNPWRWSFDRDNGQLWVADVGQATWEEVDQVTPGGNYGWRCREGAHDFNPGGTSGCGTATLIDPVAEYGHSEGESITGGYVYRGVQTTNLSGRYLFGDFVSGRIWAWIAENASTPRQPTHLLDSGLNISSFGQGNDGELYVVHYGGTLHRIVFQAGAGDATPTNLSATGCVSVSDAKQPASGLIPYAINAPFWSDGAAKDRWLALPDGQRITIGANDDWDFPNGAVLMKNFRVGSRLIETRLFMKHPDGAWGGFSYEWNVGQTDATLVRGGATRDIGGGRQWIFPSESQCLECHTNAAGRSLGLETAQLNRDFTYTQTGRTANELFTLSHIDALAPAITNPAAQPSMPDPLDAGAELSARARAYLHTNCSQCHRPGGPTSSTMDLRYTTPFNAMNACNATPQSGDLGIGANARLIAPGDAANSLVVQRANRRDQYAMPPLASTQVDAAGVALLTQWVNTLTGC
jgi:uncharacterized repeat protein (TIGR03806 family)